MTTAPGTPPAPRLLPHLWKSTLASGIVSLIVGVLVLAWPGISILVAAVAFGVYLLITGAAQVAFAFQPACFGGKPDPVVHQRGGVAYPGRLGVSSLRSGIRSPVAGHLD